MRVARMLSLKLLDLWAKRVETTFRTRFSTSTTQLPQEPSLCCQGPHAYAREHAPTS